MDERNEDGEVEIPSIEFDRSDFEDFFESAFLGKDDETIRIIHPLILEYSCKACLSDLPCEACLKKMEMHKLSAWKRCVKNSQVLRGYIMGIEGIEDIILGFCGWEKHIWKWLGESIDGRWRKESMEYLRVLSRKCVNSSKRNGDLMSLP